mmetsp:Transcript_30409/g.61241  ORF Transcript_30409/g.61241 Transcript_30409/m.61241 type:complete len:96 (-) Transcript_30409:524-811(-)
MALLEAAVMSIATVRVKGAGTKGTAIKCQRKLLQHRMACQQVGKQSSIQTLEEPFMSTTRQNARNGSILGTVRPSLHQLRQQQLVQSSVRTVVLG